MLGIHPRSGPGAAQPLAGEDVSTARAGPVASGTPWLIAGHARHSPSILSAEHKKRISRRRHQGLHREDPRQWRPQPSLDAEGMPGTAWLVGTVVRRSPALGQRPRHLTGWDSRGTPGEGVARGTGREQTPRVPSSRADWLVARMRQMLRGQRKCHPGQIQLRHPGAVRKEHRLWLRHETAFDGVRQG